MNASPELPKLRVVFATGPLVYNSMVVERVIQSGKFTVPAVILGDFIYPKMSLLRGAWTAYKKCGWQYFIFKVFETWMMKLALFAKGSRSRYHFFSQLSGLYGVPFKETRNLNSPEIIEFLKGLKPDVIVSMFAQKIGDEVMKIPRLGVINLHPGLLPEYRSFGGYFWPMTDDFGSYGYTLHFINDQIDAGDIILRKAFPITPDSTVQNLYYNSFKHGAEGLVEVLEQFAKGRVTRIPQSVEGHPCRLWPNGEAIRLLREKGYRLFRFKDFFDIYKNDL